jgi:hypothetical protein
MRKVAARPVLAVALQEVLTQNVSPRLQLLGRHLSVFPISLTISVVSVVTTVSLTLSIAVVASLLAASRR